MQLNTKQSRRVDTFWKNKNFLRVASDHTLFGRRDGGIELDKNGRIFYDKARSIRLDFKTQYGSNVLKYLKKTEFQKK